MKIAGIDVSKAKLDVAIHGQAQLMQVSNDESGLEGLIVWLSGHEVGRVGLEATGAYERLACRMLQAAGFEVVLHHPVEVKLYARLKRLRAKNDRLDAVLIAAATAHVDAVKAAGDPRLIELGDRLTAYEQAAGLIAQIKTQLEHVTLKDLETSWKAQIASLTKLKVKILADVLRRLRAHPDLARRLDLAKSLPGQGQVVAATLVIRMPELGHMKLGQAAALLGVAPYDRDTGQSRGERHIAGGRSRVRRMVYMAALAAKRCDPTLRAFAQAKAAKGKKPKVIIVAIMRKLIEATNLVLARDQPWVTLAS